MCVPWELDPWPFALLSQCSTTESQEHSIVWDTFVVFIRISQASVVCNTSQHANLQGIIWTKHALPNLSLLNLNPENQTTLKWTLFLPRAKNRHATVQNIHTGYLNVFWGVVYWGRQSATQGMYMVYMDTHLSHIFLEGLPDFQTVLALKKSKDHLAPSGATWSTFLATDLIPIFFWTCSGAIHGSV